MSASKQKSSGMYQRRGRGVGRVERAELSVARRDWVGSLADRHGGHSSGCMYLLARLGIPHSFSVSFGYGNMS